MLRTKDLYMQACLNSKDLHQMTEEERLKLQAHLRMMYFEIEKVCDRHNLRMCTGYGTVLGALRHQGFIPWDDDMDLLMPREDYEKFIRLYSNELPQGFRVYSPNSEYGPIERFAKVVDTSTKFITPENIADGNNGIFIDIFPIEGCKKGKIAKGIYYYISCILMLVASSVHECERTKRNDMYKRLLCSSPKGGKVYRIRHAIGKLLSFKSAEYWLNLVESFTRNPNMQAGCCVPVGGADRKYFTPIAEEVFFPAKRLKFDDIEVYVPNQPEYHCEMEYGDWHQIPPQESRWQHFIVKIEF